MALSRTLSDLLEQDKVAKFTKTGNTTATLGSLTLSTAVSGAGGLDTGAIAASTFYYVYTVVSSNAVRLVASTSATSPTGFTQYKKVGAFYTDSSSNIFKAYFFGEVNLTILSAKVSSAGVVTNESIGFINGNFSITDTSLFTCTWDTFIFSVTPNCVTSMAADISVASQSASSATISNTSGSFRTLAGGAKSAQAFNVICQKQGIDAIMPDWSRI